MKLFYEKNLWINLFLSVMFKRKSGFRYSNRICKRIISKSFFFVFRFFILFMQIPEFLTCKYCSSNNVKKEVFKLNCWAFKLWKDRRRKKTKRYEKDNILYATLQSCHFKVVIDTLVYRNKLHFQLNLKYVTSSEILVLSRYFIQLLQEESFSKFVL